jgi:RHS repeat-associated protein
LLYFNTAYGRLVRDGAKFRFEYFMADHLGNTRVLYASAAPGIAQAGEYRHYYPFGLDLEPLSYNSRAGTKNDRRYNGKEIQEEYGLGWYDYGWRMYDPALAKWHCSDPKAEKYFYWSPYSYCYNNPLSFIDPQGDTVKFAGATEEAAYNDYKNTVNSHVKSYDNRTQALRDKGKTGKADKRDAKRSDNVYVQIQGELSVAESNENVFMVSMGSNISNTAGAGNVSYNKAKSEIDVNIAAGGGWTTMQKVSHEFKHIDQFINLELDLNPNGGGGLLYDKTDEVAAFKRQNLFGTSVDPVSFVDENYSTRQEGPKSFHLLTPAEQTQYKTTKYIYNGKK